MNSFGDHALAYSQDYCKRYQHARCVLRGDYVDVCDLTTALESLYVAMPNGFSCRYIDTGGVPLRGGAWTIGLSRAAWAGNKVIETTTATLTVDCLGRIEHRIMWLALRDVIVDFGNSITAALCIGPASQDDAVMFGINDFVLNRAGLDVTSGYSVNNKRQAAQLKAAQALSLGVGKN
jgi:hypothetical protein